MIKAIIIDDEVHCVDTLSILLADYCPEVEIVEKCMSPKKGLEAIENLKPELVFLDIEMPGLNGISLLKSLSHRPAVVLTTAYRDYAVEGFDLEVLDYLVKPFSFSRMQQTMDRFARWRDKGVPAPDVVFLKVDKQLIQVPVKDILYVESKKDYVRVYTVDSEYLCHLTLTDITAKLPAEKFFRLHRSYTVALDKIGVLKDNCVYILGKALPVSREVRMELKRRLHR